MFSGLKLYGLIGGGLLLLAIGIGIKLHFASDERTREKLEAAEAWQGQAVSAVSVAANNPDVTKDTAIGQIVALGEDHRILLAEVEQNNRTIDEMAREAVRLRANAAELKRIADKAQAQRSAALKRLSDMALTPGAREDCLTLLAEAEEALNIAREAGL